MEEGEGEGKSKEDVWAAGKARNRHAYSTKKGLAIVKGKVSYTRSLYTVHNPPPCLSLALYLSLAYTYAPADTLPQCGMY